MSLKAVVCERYGPPEVLRIRDVAKPVPKDDEVLIRVHATTVNSGDVRIRGLRVPRGLGLLMRLRLGFSGPRQPILGLDLAGEVEAVGSGVTKFKRGDRVIASRGFDLGCHAEYRTVPQDGAIARVPDGLRYEQAVALCFGGTTALAFFRQGNLQSGEKVLINGASGAVGTAAVQIAKHMGAEVTGVCSAANAELVKSLGADHVIDYAKQDFTKSGETYDVIMDNHGNAPYSRVKGSLRPGGRFLMVIGELGQMIQASWVKAVVSGGKEDAAINADTYRSLLELAEKGALKPVIDKTYPLEQIVEAHRYVDTGRKKGSVVVTLGHDSRS